MQATITAYKAMQTIAAILIQREWKCDEKKGGNRVETYISSPVQKSN